MKFLTLLLSSAIVLTACGGPTLTAEQRAARDANLARAEAAVASAQNAQINGKTFRVAVVDNRSYALVDLVSPADAPHHVAELQDAARAVTGCQGKFDGGVLNFLSGDINALNLTEIRGKMAGTFNGWHIALTC